MKPDGLFNALAFQAAIRRKRGVTPLREAAAAMGPSINPAMVHRWESGASLPTLEHYAVICRWLGVRVGVFFREPSVVAYMDNVDE